MSSGDESGSESGAFMGAGYMEGKTAQLIDPAGYAEAFVRVLPKNIRDRVLASAALNEQLDQLQKDRFRELMDIERKYLTQIDSVLSKQSGILNGTNKDLAADAIAKGEALLAAEAAKIREDEKSEEDEDKDKDGAEAAKQRLESAATNFYKFNLGCDDVAEAIAGSTRVPGFWLTALQNCGDFDEEIQPHDYEILRSLVDISCIPLAAPWDGFAIRFVFEKNDAIVSVKRTTAHHKEPFKALPEVTDAELRAGVTVPAGGHILTKVYYLHCDEDGDEAVCAAEGTEITWATGKNPRVEIQQKKQKKKGSGGKKVTRTVEVEVPRPSFFDFFDAPSLDVEDDEDEEGGDMMAAEKLEHDHATARLIRSRLLPRAVLWFTGHAVRSGMGADGDDDDDDDDDDEDEDEDVTQKYKSIIQNKKGGGSGGAGGKQGGEGKEECKQQ